ncbi:NADH-quinone oxidoreductase subunit G [compost metagenome]
MRLIEPQGDRLQWRTGIPAPFNPAAGTWQVVPFHHLFGSEENSSRAAPVQERIPQAYAALGTSEAARLAVNDGTFISLTVAGQALRLPVRIDAELAAGLVALPVGFAGIPPRVVGQTASGLQEVAQ